ncbi:globin domain-containing protein [Spirosoma areae]
MLTTDHIKLVKQTWTTLRDVDPALLGDVFYTHLFIQHPNLRPLFNSPMLSQYNKLVEMLNFAVARVDMPNELQVTLQQLGLRHQQYGVKPEHYSAVGNALLWTLQTALGSTWTVEVGTAWGEFYQWLAHSMQNDL